MDQNKQENTRLGLSLVTAACLDPDTVADEHLQLIREGLRDDPDFEVKANVGLTNLAIWLLVLLEKETGRPMESFLALIGEKLAAGETP